VLLLASAVVAAMEEGAEVALKQHSGTAGADAAAGLGRSEQQQQLTEHPLALARPVLLAVALWQFMEKGRYPEVAVSCVFQLWRSQVARARWPDATTDLCKGDVEAQAPMIHDSRTSAGSFAYVEQLGVTPPPAAGWVPREDWEDDRGIVSPRGSGRKDWWANRASKDWIYHSNEDMYFHLPSNSLWERREMRCCDPEASQHTFCRVDAVHLQALSHFAKSMDSALVPMAWQAWVRYARKRNGHHTAAQPPPVSPVGQRPVTSDLKRPVKASSPRTSNSGPQCSAGPPEPSQQPEPPSGCGGAAAEPSKLAAAGDADGGAGVAAVPATPAVLAGAPAVPPKAAPAGSKAAAAGGSTREAEGEKKRRGGFCLCLRSRSRPGKIEYGSAPRTDLEGGPGPPKNSQVRGAASTASAGSDVSKAMEWATKLNEQLQPEATEAKEASQPTLDAVDRHMRRLEIFLAEVKRNPQRLITHVERRRAERTYLAYVVV